MVSSSMRILLLLAVGAAAAGCQQGPVEPAGGDVVDAPPAALSVYQLAGRLGLEVVVTTDTHVVLRDGANTVLVFADPEGRAFVNGAQVGPVGGVAWSDGIVFVPAAMEQPVRAALRSRPRVAPAPRPVRRSAAVEPPAPPARYRVVIDPGHGGRDPGATSVLGYHEKVVNLRVAREAAGLLGQWGIAVKLTRDRDEYVGLDERAEIAHRFAADLFVSVHADSFRNPSPRGFTVYVARFASPRSRSAGRALVAALAATGLPSRDVREKNLQVLVRTRCPAVLVEMGYLSNPQEAALLGQADFQQRMARAIAAGIRDHLGGR